MKYKVTIELTDGTTRDIYEEATNRKDLDELIDLNTTIDFMYIDFKRVISIEETNWKEPEAPKKEEKCPNCIELEKEVKELKEHIKDIEVPY